jgi:hypothetical protein
VAGAQQARPVPRYTIEQFMNTTAMFGASFSPDERSILVTSDQSGVFNAYEIAAGGGKPQARTHATKDGVFTVGKSRSLWNDARLVAQCARLDGVVVTSNAVDLQRLGRLIPARTAAPFPPVGDRGRSP